VAMIADLEEALRQNGRAMEDGPKRKTCSMHDLKNIQALTPTQEDMIHAWINGKNICAHGTAGTGKTFLAIYLALQEVLTKRQNKIIIVRSAVPTREVGFLPGTLEEKMEQFEEPYYNIFWELLGRPSTYADMKAQGLVEFHSTSFLRGLTWDNAIIIFDEAQNGTFHEINSVMTRLGQNTRVIISGDTAQTDLDGSRRLGAEGLSSACKAFQQMGSFECIEFNPYDIVRGDLVKSWILACEHIGLY